MARSVAGAQGRTNRRFLLVAVLLGGLAMVLVYAKLSSLDGGDSGSPAAGSTQIVVAKTAIKQRTLITAEMLELKSIPTNLVVDGAFISVNDAVGKVTKLPVEPNEQLTAAAVVDTSGATSTDALSLVVPTGKRAMSIEASQVSNAGGLILPGDYVDLVWLCCDESSVIALTLIRNVQVAAVAQSIVSGPSDPGTPADDPVSAEAGEPDPEAVTITLLLSPQEAQRVFLAEQSGKLRADLRNLNDTEVSDTPATLITEILPPELIAALPEQLKPNGYRQGQ